MSLRRLFVLPVLTLGLSYGQASHAWPDLPKIQIQNPLNLGSKSSDPNKGDKQQSDILLNISNLAQDGLKRVPSPLTITSARDMKAKLENAKSFYNEALLQWKKVKKPELDKYEAKANLDKLSATLAASEAAFGVVETGAPIRVLHERDQPVLPEDIKAFEQSVDNYAKGANANLDWVEAWRLEAQSFHKKNVKYLKSRQPIPAKSGIVRDSEAIAKASREAQRAFRVITTSSDNNQVPSEIEWAAFDRAVKAGFDLAGYDFTIYWNYLAWPLRFASLLRGDDSPENIAQFFGAKLSEIGHVKGKGAQKVKINTKAGSCYLVTGRPLERIKNEQMTDISFVYNSKTSSHHLWFFDSIRRNTTYKNLADAKFFGLCSQKDSVAEFIFTIESPRSDVNFEWISVELATEQFTPEILSQITIIPGDSCDYTYNINRWQNAIPGTIIYLDDEPLLYGMVSNFYIHASGVNGKDKSAGIGFHTLSSTMPEELSLSAEFDETCQFKENSAYEPAVAHAKCVNKYKDIYVRELYAAEKALENSKTVAQAKAAEIKVGRAKAQLNFGIESACKKTKGPAFAGRKKAFEENTNWLLSRPTMTPEIDLIGYLRAVERGRLSFSSPY